MDITQRRLGVSWAERLDGFASSGAKDASNLPDYENKSDSALYGS
jgi:hypothetical protein